MHVSAAWRVDPLVRIFFEFGQTMLAAEVVSLTIVLVLPGSVFWFHGHSANWISGHADLLLSFSQPS